MENPEKTKIITDTEKNTSLFKFIFTYECRYPVTEQLISTQTQLSQNWKTSRTSFPADDSTKPERDGSLKIKLRSGNYSEQIFVMSVAKAPSESAMIIQCLVLDRRGTQSLFHSFHDLALT